MRVAPHSKVRRPTRSPCTAGNRRWPVGGRSGHQKAGFARSTVGAAGRGLASWGRTDPPPSAYGTAASKPLSAKIPAGENLASARQQGVFPRASAGHKWEFEVKTPRPFRQQGVFSRASCGTQAKIVVKIGESSRTTRFASERGDFSPIRQTGCRDWVTKRRKVLIRT